MQHQQELGRYFDNAAIITPMLVERANQGIQRRCGLAHHSGNVNRIWKSCPLYEATEGLFVFAELSDDYAEDFQIALGT